MTHRLGFRGYIALWAAGIFYTLMVITSPTEMIPFTKDIIVGIFGAANTAGEHVGEARDDYERQQLREELETELENSGWQPPPTTNEDGNDGDESGDEDASGYDGPLPHPDQVWDQLRTVNDTVAGQLDDHHLTLNQQGGGS
jgi:hypothetical protein